MRTKVTPQRLNQALLTGINWLPHLLVLQGMWLLYSLPLITSTTASRALIETLTELRNDGLEASSKARFQQAFHQQWATRKGQDRLLSLFFLLLLADSFIFSRLQHPLFQIASYALAFTFGLFCLVLLYQTRLLHTYPQQPSSLFYNFYQFARSPKRVLAHLLATVTLVLTFLLFGPVYLLVLGISTLYLVNVLLCDQALK